VFGFPRERPRFGGEILVGKEGRKLHSPTLEMEEEQYLESAITEDGLDMILQTEMSPLNDPAESDVLGQPVRRRLLTRLAKPARF
jgi:hypothetical protein